MGVSGTSGGCTVVAIEAIEEASSPPKPWKLLGLVVEEAASRSTRVKGS